MKAFSFRSGKGGDLAASLESCKHIEPQVVLLFTGSALAAQPETRDVIRNSGLPVIGCSTVGEISADGVSDNAFSGLALHFDAATVRFAKSPLKGYADSREAGEKLATQLAGEELRAVFSICPGSYSDSGLFVKGLSRRLGAGVLLTGGVAGRLTEEGPTWAILNDLLPDTDAVAVGFYGKNLSVRHGTCGGWKPFGPVRRVTRAEGNEIFELDGKPALPLYKEYLGEKAAGLPFTGLMFPFAILTEENRQDTGLIRTLMAVDHDANTLKMAAAVPQGSLVRMMHADNDSLVDAARNAAEDAGMDRAQASIVISCAGRKILMGSDVEEEIDAVLDVVGKNRPFAGFYSYGEICPYAGSGYSELHHQTMTITTFSEEKAD